MGYNLLNKQVVLDFNTDLSFIIQITNWIYHIFGFSIGLPNFLISTKINMFNYSVEVGLKFFGQFSMTHVKENKEEYSQLEGRDFVNTHAKLALFPTRITNK